MKPNRKHRRKFTDSSQKRKTIAGTIFQGQRQENDIQQWCIYHTCVRARTNTIKTPSERMKLAFIDLKLVFIFSFHKTQMYILVEAIKSQIERSK